MAQVARARVTKGEKILSTQAKRLFQLLDENDLAAAVKVWRDGVKATKKFWDYKTKSWIEEPDWKVRGEMANTIVAYMEGLPVQRQIQVNANVDDFGTMLEKFRNSPEAMRVYKEMTGEELPAIDVESDSLQSGPSERNLGSSPEAPLCV